MWFGQDNRSFGMFYENNFFDIPAYAIYIDLREES